MSVRFHALVAVGLLASACGEPPSVPDSTSSIVINEVSPSSGSTVVVPPQYRYNEIGGVVLPPQSGVVSVSLTLRSAHEVQWAQLYVYLGSEAQESGYCGQNLPDAPTWGFLPAGWTTTYTVTGFQVLLPCDVTSVRAYLHTRNNGLLTPPTAAETIAQATLPVSFHLRR